jgi:hypothetical protein
MIEDELEPPMAQPARQVRMRKNSTPLLFTLVLVMPLTARARDASGTPPVRPAGPLPRSGVCIVLDPCGLFWLPGAGIPAGTAPPPLANPGSVRKPASEYARPIAAPPSPTAASAPPQTETLPKPALPAGPPKPAVSEVRSYYDTYAVAPDRSSQPLGERCSIEFWNLSSHDLTLKVDGSSRQLKTGQNLLLELGRHFVWQVEGREPQRENIPLGESALEIVIRR